MARRDLSIRPSKKYLQPFIDEFIKQNGAKKWTDINKQQRYRFYDEVIPKIDKFLKESKGLIRRKELAKLLDVDNDYLRAIAKSDTAGPTGKPSVRYRLFQDILGDVKRIYRPITGQNEGFYKKPTAAAIEAFKKANRSSTILPVMQERVNAFLNSKPFMKMLRNDKLTDPDFLDKAKKLFPKLDLTDQKVADGILYIARGSKGDEFLGTTIKKDIPLHKRLIKEFENAKWGNPLHAAAYKFARTEIDQQLGNKEGSFKTYQDKLRQALKNSGIKNFKNYEVDEFVGTSIGGKQQVAPYSVFSRYLTKAVNGGPGAAYQGALSRASTELTGIINEFGSDSKQAIDYVKDFNKNKAAAFEAKHKIKAARLDLRMPEEVFGKKRFAELGTIGEQMTDVVKQKGFGYQLPKEALTQKEVLVKLASRNAGNICQLFRKEGGRIGFAAGSNCSAQMEFAFDNDPVKLSQDINKLPEESGVINQAKGAASRFLNLAKKGGKFGALAAVGAAGAGAVKTFMNDDPTTYLSNEDQQKNMLIDMVTGSLDDTPVEEAPIGDAYLPTLGAVTVAGTAATAPSTIDAARSGALGATKSGITKTALKTLGRGLTATATPLGLLATEPLYLAEQIQEGDSLGEIATNPFNYLGAAFAGPATEFATKGLKNPGIAKAMRLGISPGALKTVSRRFGLPGLALSLGISGYETFDDYRNKRGMFSEE